QLGRRYGEDALAGHLSPTPSERFGMDHTNRIPESPTNGAGHPSGHADGVPRRDFLRGALVGLGSAAASAWVETAGARRAAAQTTQKREFVTAQAGDVSRFDPHLSTSANDIRVTFNIFDPLLTRRVDGKLHPSLATEWKRTAPTMYQFKLRQGVKWHN